MRMLGPESYVTRVHPSQRGSYPCTHGHTVCMGIGKRVTVARTWRGLGRTHRDQTMEAPVLGAQSGLCT